MRCALRTKQQSPSGEAEYYAIVKGSSVGIGITALAEDMGVTLEKPIEVRTDASAAVGIANRIGAGKVRHIEVNQLWVQEKVATGKIRIKKVWTESNLADALTKPVNAEIIATHLAGVSCEARVDRHPAAPKIESDGGDEAMQPDEVACDDSLGE